MDYTTGQQMPAEMPQNHKMKWVSIIVAALLIAGIAIWFLVGSKGGFGKVLGASTTSTYQAVFLTNGQVYFGKFADKGDWIELSDIYYLQVTQNLQAAATSDQAKNAAPNSGTTPEPANNIQLVKLGSELHGPTDTMHIERDKVLFWEDMKEDSKVVSAIKQYKSK
jgi:hypothetical protein